MNEYLTDLQTEHAKYLKKEERLREFLNRHMYELVDGISLIDGKVVIETTESFCGETYRETYKVPFDYFKDVKTFVTNIVKFRD